MTGDGAEPRRGVMARLVAPAFFLLVAATLLVALGLVVDLPPVLMAVGVGAIAVSLPVFFAGAVAASREPGIGPFRAVGRSIRETFRLVSGLCDILDIF